MSLRDWFRGLFAARLPLEDAVEEDEERLLGAGYVGVGQRGLSPESEFLGMEMDQAADDAVSEYEEKPK